MNVIEEMCNISRRLRQIAKEIENTAIGSSRSEMYRLLADHTREEADNVEALTKAVR